MLPLAGAAAGAGAAAAVATVVDGADGGGTDTARSWICKASICASGREKGRVVPLLLLLPSKRSDVV